MKKYQRAAIATVISFLSAVLPAVFAVFVKSDKVFINVMLASLSAIMFFSTVALAVVSAVCFVDNE